MVPQCSSEPGLTLEEFFKLETVCQEFLSKKNNLAFNDLVNLASQVGFKFKNQDGTSHRHAKHPTYEAGPPAYDKITLQSRKGKAIPYQVEQLIKFIQTAKIKREKQ